MRRLLLHLFGHRYLSTACLHGLHGPECGGAQRDRNDSSHPHCKFCTARCRCRCHKGKPVRRRIRQHRPGCVLAATNPHHRGWCELEGE